MPVPGPLLSALWCLGAFLAGSVPFGLVLVELAGKGDVRTHGSGNIGATNVSRVGGKALGLATLLLDILKGWFPVWLFSHHHPGSPILAVVALAAVLGHVFTPWLKFQGGKGVATTLGAALAYDPVLVAPSFGLFAAALLLTRFVSLGSVLGAAALPVTVWIRGGGARAGGTAVWTLLALIIIVKHRENLRRLVQGTEAKLWGASKDAGEAKHG